ncbi:MAG: serine/threonine-protein kinase, partial [Planctomycetota bacterium]
AGSFIGTPAYAAPEQMDGLATSDQRVDVFALGITAFELITGQLPYQVNSIVDLAYHQKNTPLPSARKLNPDVSPELDRLLQEMCAKRPEDRPQTMGAVVERLEMLLEFTRSGVRRPTGGMQTRMIVKEEAGDHVVYVSNDDSDKEPELPDYPMAAPGFQPGFMPGSTDSGEFMQPGKQPHSPELDVQLPAAEAELIPVEKEDDEKSRLRAQLTSILLGPDAAARKAAPGRAPTPAEVAAAAAAAMAAGGAAGGGTGAAGAATTPKPATTAVGGAVDDSGRQKEVRLNLATTIHSRSRGPQFSLFSASSLFWMAVAALLIVASLMKSGVIPLPGGVTF